MGYKRGKTVYVLTFDDPEYAAPETGDPLVVKTSAASLGQYMDILELLSAPMTRETIIKLFTQWAELLVEWNVEDDAGVPVPTTVDGLLSLDLPFAQYVIGAWRDEMDRLAAPDDPLEDGSSSGEPSPEVSIPMASLSENQAS